MDAIDALVGQGIEAGKTMYAPANICRKCGGAMLCEQFVNRADYERSTFKCPNRDCNGHRQTEFKEK